MVMVWKRTAVASAALALSVAVVGAAPKSTPTKTGTDKGSTSDAGSKSDKGVGGEGTSTSTGTKKPGELMKDAPTGDAAGPTKFLPATQEEGDAMIAKAKAQAADVGDGLKIKFQTLETAHFIVFTDWDVREQGFLKTNVEGAYDLVSKQFDIPKKENIFVGKLPVFMFNKVADFRRYATQFDKFAIPDNIAGYYMGNNLGQGHLAMWKPDVSKTGGNVDMARERWGYVLVHEFTHAFVARYRTNAFIPRWLNEGLAEVIASQKFPRPSVYADVKSRQKEIDVTRLLRQKDLLKAEDYPVARTVVETLIVGDRKAFLTFFNDVKDGVTVSDALKARFNTDEDGLGQAWRKYVGGTKKR